MVVAPKKDGGVRRTIKAAANRPISFLEQHAGQATKQIIQQRKHRAEKVKMLLVASVGRKRHQAEFRICWCTVHLGRDGDCRRRQVKCS